MSLELTLFSET
jgi:hypothetical protein